MDFHIFLVTVLFWDFPQPDFSEEFFGALRLICEL
jgi:hypothetical protein